MSNRTAALCRLLAPPPDPRADGDLLTAFVRNSDEAAFAELIRRHGPLMLSACRRLLPDRADAEDAFQSAFVVLIRRASRLKSLPSLGPWLYRVAVLTAQNIRRHNARRFARQSVLPDSVHDRSAAITELRLDLDDALLRLPEKLRTPIVLCHLQGWSRRDAAQRLGCPEGTLSSLLARGLAKLRRRLSGLDPTKMLVVPSILIPTVLSTTTVRAATAALASSAFLPTISTLAEGVLRMFWIKKTTAATMALAAVFGMGVSIGVSVRQVPHVGAADNAGTVTVPVADSPTPEEMQLARHVWLAHYAEKNQEVAELMLDRAIAQLERAKAGNKQDAIEEAAVKVREAERDLARTKQLAESHRAVVAALQAKSKPQPPADPEQLAKALEALAKAESKAQLDELKIQISAAKADLEVATANLQLAKANLDLVAKAGTPVAIEKAKAEVQVAEAKLAAAKKRYEVLSVALAEMDAKVKSDPKAPPATDSDKQLAETRALLEQLRAQRAKLEADLRMLQRSAQDLDAKSEAVVEQLKLLELKKAKEAKEKAAVPPLPAASGPAFVVSIGDENPNIACTLTEIGANGKAIGTLTCDNADILRVTLTRAMKDANAPKELRLTIKSSAKYSQVVPILDACKTAGFKDVKVSTLLERRVPITSAGQPAAVYRSVTERLDEETTTIDRYLEKLKPAKP